LVLVVSEEAGTVSIAIKGSLERGLEKKQLKEKLINYLK
jgi:DNA integrity scanning protein DisA with diadenylate cyclase activity